VVVRNPFRFPDGPFIEIGIEIAIDPYAGLNDRCPRRPEIQPGED
jgi:hypothetical protein